jgi:hypothetical protein
MLFRGRIPCKKRHINILTLLGTFNFQRIFQTGFIAELPGSAN